MARADVQAANADALEWIRDWAIFCAMHPVAVAAFRRAIEKGEETPGFVRTAGRVTGTTRAVGEPAITSLKLVKGGRS